MKPIRGWCGSILRSLASTLALVLASVGDVNAQTGTADMIREIGKLSIEELLNLDVTSVTRTEESLARSAAAIAVVTGEEIRRSGARSIPDALRLIPGVFVGQRNANTWAVGSRGFSSVNSEKLLVLSDTRSIYTPLLSGVFWDVQNFVLEDIERIEVIRGPGGTLWGSNAVNGVINIITKDSAKTQGSYIAAGGGNEDRASVVARYGGMVGEDLSYRIFGQYFDRDETFREDPAQSDAWQMGHAGFRSDWRGGARDVVTLQGEIYNGDVGQLAPSVNVIGRPGPEGGLEASVWGGNVLARWQRQLESGSNVQLRAYYDRTRRNDPTFDDELDTGDVDFQHRMTLTPSQELIWGANYRYTANTNEGKGVFALDPSSSDDDIVGAFVQDQIFLRNDLRLTLGTKLEHNDFSGTEVQPNARLAWEISHDNLLWGAVSRAVRVPTRLERDVKIDAADPQSDPLPRLLGNDDFDSEELIAYEIGYRWQPLESLSLDLATFYNDYDKLASLELGDPFLDPDGRTIVPVLNENEMEGAVYGAEALVNYLPHPSWRLTGSFTYTGMNLHADGLDINNSELREGSTPRLQFGLRSFLDLPGGLELDMQYRDIGRIRSQPEDAEGGEISRYAELDVRLGYRITDRIGISVTGQNLLHRRHTEFGDRANRGKIERAVFGEITARF